MVNGVPNHKKSSSNQLENQLRETVERYELLFSATNDVVYEIDFKTGRVVWNDALYTQYGYDRDQEDDQLEWWTAHVHPDDAMRLENEITNWLNGKNDVWQSEYRFRKADGTYVDVRDRGVVQRAENGNPLRIIGSFLDITKQKQLDRAKDEFISLASHQLRTPLTAIRMYSEMLTNGMMGPLSDHQQKQVMRTTGASVRLIKLVSSILDMSRIELGHIPFNPIPSDINALIQTSIQEVQPLALEKGVTIHYEHASKIKVVTIDTNILSQMLNKLLTNAVRYTKPNEGVIEVAFVRRKENYILSVKDNGIGIPREERTRIFNRFYRGNNTANIEEEGTGLGLSMVKQLAETANYSVRFESVLGKGTTFYIDIPKV